MRKWFLTVVFFLLLGGPALAGELTISAAASTNEAVTELAKVFHTSHGEITVNRNFASSGALAKQIAQGAPADIFISANPKWMAYLVDQRRIASGQERTLAYNSLVLVGRKDLALTSLSDLARLQRIALGSPKSVPAGQYAVQALQAAGVYQQLQGRLVMTQDVRQALAYADRGEVDAAFVYKTDALLVQRAVILLEVPQDLYDPVSYPVGLTVAGAKNPAAAAFYAFLGTPAAAKILEKYGFVVK